MIEDNAKLAGSLKRGLEQEGYAVDTAPDGEAGWKKLLAGLRSCLRRPRESLPGELKVGDLVLDVSKARVFRAGAEIKLTLKEFRLLEYFMRHHSQVLLREQIVGHLWDFDFDSVSNVLDAHMKNLRKKVDGGYDEKLFETVRGMGYRLKG